jgi:hypothetical protein
LNFEKAMEAEHCKMRGCKVLFETGSKKRKTCPEYEWAITVRSDYTHVDSRSSRKPKMIEDLMKLNVVEEAKLERCEVIAVVLYTGPMVSWITVLS